MEYILSLGGLFYVIVFCVGLSIGSFTNAWIWRTRENVRIVQGRSMCIFCHRQLMWYENIPVLSFVALRGKCRVCKNVIPAHYVCVEILTAIVFVLLAWQNVHSNYPDPIVLLRNLIFTGLLAVIFVYDLLYQEILSGVIWFGAFTGLFFNFYLDYNLTALLIGALAAGGFFLFQFMVSGGRWIGGGDVRLGVMMGVWLGWPVVLAALVLAYVAGAFISVGMILLRKKTLHSSTPFGTYLAVATFVCMLWGSDIVHWYSQFLR